MSDSKNDEVKHPCQKLYEFGTLMSCVPQEKREEISSYFDILQSNIFKCIDSYKQMESTIDSELQDIKYEIKDVITNKKEIPEDELYENLFDLIKAKKDLYNVIEKFTSVLEKRIFNQENLEGYNPN